MENGNYGDNGVNVLHHAMEEINLEKEFAPILNLVVSHVQEMELIINLAMKDLVQ